MTGFSEEGILFERLFCFSAKALNLVAVLALFFPLREIFVEFLKELGDWSRELTIIT